ncbi:MAG: nucleotidyltransferase domain-containing protein [Bacteroidetes bacterium]|nr:nucleotidyltransferase domain-containing protein [Bacteroidota bacterium]
MAKLLDKRFDMSGVSIVYLFGSRAEKKSNAMSDIDIGVVFKDEPRDEEVPRLYTELYDILTDHFPNFQIDLVFLQKANLELRFDAISHGRVLFESSQAMRLDFEERAMMMYADFRPLLDEFDRAILERI